MVTIENISEQGLQNILMNVASIIDSHFCNSSPESGMQLDKEWITPEGCYWLYKLLSLDETRVLVSNRVLERIKNGTNHPESLK